MSRSNQPRARVACPDCNGTVVAPIPGPRSNAPPGSDGPRLRGTETNCRNCERELEVYYY